MNNTREKSCHENLRHGNIHDEGIEDHGNTWRNKNAKGTGRGKEPDGKTVTVALLDEGRHHDAPDGNDRCRGRAGDGGKEHTCHNRCHGKAPGKPSHKEFHDPHQSARDGAFCHDVAGKDKKGTSKKNKIVETVKELLDKRCDGCIGNENEVNGRGSCEKKGYGHA